MALKTGAGTANSGLEKEYVCKMIEETVQGCARVYAHCFDDREMRYSTVPAPLLTVH